MKDDPNLDLIRRYIAAYNSFDLDGMVALLHPDLVFRNLSGDAVSHETHGIAAFRALADLAVGMVTERAQTMTRVTRLPDAPDPGLRVEISYRALLARDLPRGPPAGSEITLAGESTFRFRDGLIVSIEDRS